MAKLKVTVNALEHVRGICSNQWYFSTEVSHRQYLVIASLPFQQLQGHLSALSLHEQSGI